jgi:hypothetical protein
MESAIRRVVNLRLKGASIYWLEESAEAMLLLRSFYKSGRWDMLNKHALSRGCAMFYRTDFFGMRPLHQTASVLTRLFSNIAGTENEMLTVSVYKRHESSAHSRKHGLRGFIKFSPVVGTLSPGFFS